MPLRRLALISDVAARWVAHDEPREVLVWVREWGIWNTGSERELYAALCGRPGDDADLERAPGHLLGPAEPAGALIALCVSLGWGVSVFAAVSDRVFSVNHDGVCWCAGLGAEGFVLEV